MTHATHYVVKRIRRLATRRLEASCGAHSSPRTRGIVALFFALTATWGMAFAVDPATAPMGDQTPVEVVQLQMEALGENAVLGDDGGIEIAFRFASPANKQQTGPLTKFISIVRAPAYAIMIDHRSVEFGEARIAGDTALVPVIVNAPNGERAGFMFRLSKHSTGDCDACWMTDGVERIELNDTQA